MLSKLQHEVLSLQYPKAVKIHSKSRLVTQRGRGRQKHSRTFVPLTTRRQPLCSSRYKSRLLLSLSKPMSETSPRQRTAPTAPAQGEEQAAGVCSLPPSRPAQATSDPSPRSQVLLRASSCDLRGASTAPRCPRPSLRSPPSSLTRTEPVHHNDLCCAASCASGNKEKSALFSLATWASV